MSHTNKFEFQLDILMKEMNFLQTGVDRITLQIKYWVIIIWGAAFTLAIGNTEHNTFQGRYLFTALIPFLLWLVDGCYRRIQRQFIYRINQLAKFYNSENLAISFTKQSIIGIQFYDFRGLLTGRDRAYLKFTSLLKVLFFPQFFYSIVH